MRHSVFHRRVLLPLIGILLMGVAGCVSLAERNPVPAALSGAAHVDGVRDARFWGDEWPKFSKSMYANHTAEQLREEYPAIYGKPHDYLAISGGGANGAFGAGLLVGWSAAGTRPEFTMVTGVSTGALMAPFAFLGSAYDHQLERLYTAISTRDIAVKHNIITTLLGNSAFDTSPLKALIAENVDAELIDAIAREHRTGRRLLIGTFDLDAGRSVIWNIGAIANSSSANKHQLIQEVLLASASIPGVFPPVMIPVRAGGRMYEEMHVDGGSGSQVFVYPAAVDWRQINSRLDVQGQPQVFVIRNSLLNPDYSAVKSHVLPIASRSIGSLIRTQGIGDLYQIYALCERDGNDFNLAYIPSDFSVKPQEKFDPVYMRQLFDLGYRMAAKGNPWKKSPPGLELPTRD
ncbi:patatin-like phospholipase family protein [Microbulbifer sp. ALW1]|uniref:patatin-like phospholipase family protein n=1 Tax=Microbulbifer sp. (strain ALW1) TaxID=1516059 RepID=UPI00135A0AC2|nr:patatin-like phospholipase family protein [Microbulbifer sp. ALW1]